MCQMSVMIEREGIEELVMEDVTSLVVEPDGLQISTLFEGPKKVEHAVIRSIDFMAGKVLLQQAG